ncbi:MAG: tetratricopeptide repeat protein [Myxococcota bacterium]
MLLHLLSSGCAGQLEFAQSASPSYPRSPPPTAHHKLDGAVVRLDHDPLTQLEVYGPADLLRIATQKSDGHEMQIAERLYRRLIEQFPDSELTAAANFNLGLLAEGRQDFSVAAVLYGAVIDKPLPIADDMRRTWVDAHFRRAVCLGSWVNGGAVWRCLTKFSNTTGCARKIDLKR